MHAIVLAGGFGTRLRARVSDVPKPMAPVAGRPFLEFVLDQLVAAGCSDVILCVGYLADVVEAHFGVAYRGLGVRYLREQSPLGTGGATAAALAEVPSGRALVLNGDSYMQTDLRPFIDACRAEPERAAIVLRRIDDVSRYGSAMVDGDRLVAFGEKSAQGPGLINAGIYWLDRRSFERLGLAGAFSLENDYFAPHARDLGARAQVAEGHFIDIGLPNDYDRAQQLLPAWTRSP